ncbi:Uncharacterised protein [Burkholderia pseudomallei]|nr:Uncharacterised protein [Burkholderia pseudomallei]CAJ6709691.1 Uncharacterised protein [Burkholderia pseudomallei]
MVSNKKLRFRQLPPHITFRAKLSSKPCIGMGLMVGDTNAAFQIFSASLIGCRSSSIIPRSRRQGLATQLKSGLRQDEG